jgi:hypothetical protein
LENQDFNFMWLEGNAAHWWNVEIPLSHFPQLLPSDYSFQVAISICARLAEGKSLRAICSEAGTPGRATVFRWIARHKEFRDEYTLACELRAEDLADEMIEMIEIAERLHDTLIQQ